jgi:N-acyl-D-amino-acid deacylase
MVHKMTGLPAQTLRLPDRGVLAPGRAADVVVFDPERYTDVATYLEPQRYAAGVEHLLVNGQLALERGTQTDVMAGVVVRAVT